MSRGELPERKQDSEHNRVSDIKSEKGSKTNFKFLPYLSRQRGGGGHVRGGGSEERGGRDQAEVQGASAKLSNRLTRLGGENSEKKAG